MHNTIPVLSTEYIVGPTSPVLVHRANDDKAGVVGLPLSSIDELTENGTLPIFGIVMALSTDAWYVDNAQCIVKGHASGEYLPPCKHQPWVGCHFQ
jgi:hypothetical protein